MKTHQRRYLKYGSYFSLKLMGYSMEFMGAEGFIDECVYGTSFLKPENVFEQCIFQILPVQDFTMQKETRFFLENSSVQDLKEDTNERKTRNYDYSFLRGRG